MKFDLRDRNIRFELCCDQCGEVIHSHFDCPACGGIDVGTDAYCVVDFREEDAPDMDRTFECEACHAKFRALEPPDDDWSAMPCEVVGAAAGGKV